MNDIENQIVEWHRATFPRATLGAIFEKFEEEYREFYDESCELEEIFRDHAIEEFADMCIVYMAGLAKLGRPSLFSYISAKLEINKARKWGKETANGDRIRDKSV